CGERPSGWAWPSTKIARIKKPDLITHRPGYPCRGFGGLHRHGPITARGSNSFLRGRRQRGDSTFDRFPIEVVVITSPGMQHLPANLASEAACSSHRGSLLRGLIRRTAIEAAKQDKDFRRLVHRTRMQWLAHRFPPSTG